MGLVIVWIGMSPEDSLSIPRGFLLLPLGFDKVPGPGRLAWLPRCLTQRSYGQHSVLARSCVAQCCGTVRLRCTKEAMSEGRGSIFGSSSVKRSAFQLSKLRTKTYSLDRIIDKFLGGIGFKSL